MHFFFQEAVMGLTEIFPNHRGTQGEAKAKQTQSDKLARLISLFTICANDLGRSLVMQIKEHL